MHNRRKFRRGNQPSVKILRQDNLFVHAESGLDLVSTVIKIISLLFGNKIVVWQVSMFVCVAYMEPLEPP